MSGYQRMVVIPQNEYIQLTSLQEVKRPFAQQFFKAEQNYEDAATISDPYTRLVMRSENMERMKALKENMRNYISLATPKPYRTRAERLLSILEPHMKWTEKGELIDSKTNQPIERSQLSDLILHSVQDRRRNISPAGWDYFVERLREYNVPQMLLNLPTLEDLKRKDIKSHALSSSIIASRKRRSKSTSAIERGGDKSIATTKPPRKKLRPKKYSDFLTTYSG